MSQKLFPEYLGVSSQGAAVVDLQMFLLGMLVVTHNKLAKELKPDGDYGDVTRRAVWWLQGRLNRMRKQHSDTSWPVLEEDGNFGPAARAAVLSAFGFNFDAVPFYEDTLAKFPDSSMLLVWPVPSDGELETPPDVVEVTPEQAAMAQGG
ncbi:MAG TPA: hypothetical protein DDW36_01415 [Candidatus Magasanikbacteria bacterium]|nr:hypothetical protein [Candidatus Magasanikbacteria bacterium]